MEAQDLCGNGCHVKVLRDLCRVTVDESLHAHHAGRHVLDVLALGSCVFGEEVRERHTGDSPKIRFGHLPPLDILLAIM